MTAAGGDVTDKVRMLLELQRNDEARRLALEGLQREPNDPVLLGLLAFALEADGLARDARMWAERALAIDPQLPWVHAVRARAILNSAGTPQEAVESAYAAVQLDMSHPGYRYTLTRAYLAAKQPAAANTTAAMIRSVDPNSALGPLALALVEIDRARFFRVNPGLAVIAVLLTRGIALLVFALIWFIYYLRRRGPLRRADAYLLEALRLDPGNPATHSIASTVARFRFRYVQSVDSALASAAIDTGMINAGELAASIVRRTSGLAVAAFAFWFAWLPVLNGAGALVAEVGSTALAVGLAVGVGWFDREQTKRLPAGVLRLVRRRWLLPITLLVLGGIAAAIAWASRTHLGWAIPAAVTALLALAAAALLLLLSQRFRRVLYR
jgi:tetratricopeptide (TPR) repeat protein